MNHEETIFEQALGIAAQPAREEFLRSACAGDDAMLERIQGLLHAHDRAGRFLEHERPADGAQLPPAATAAFVVPPSGGAAPGPAEAGTPNLLTEKPGDRIGRYKLLQKIGEGGCGVVYMAEQQEPIRRRVALKIIKLGMDTRQVIARFEAERQALAMMDHPNIAKVFDAGATESPHNVAQASSPASSGGGSPPGPMPGGTPGQLAGEDARATLSAGRPYFVMELVRGVKITEYCDEKMLTTHQRLELFTQVCRAVQHAHQKGIIHRDLKPSNILVSFNDGVAVPKVIDFGIAKATTGEPLTDKTVFTAFEQFIGTPAYMSPEQALVTSLDIDTRTDIYSLGVLLYELLTGQTPFDPKELLKAGLDEMRRTIREKEPVRPSTRLSTLPGEALSTTAQRRGLDAPKLVSQLRGDLDWIVMKCLEKDRARRYETANGLATDIQRHLKNEPVVARPPSNLYRFQKTIRRNRLAFAAAGAVIAALLIGLGFSTLMFIRERDASRRASEGEKKAERAAGRARRAETSATEKLWDSYLAQAQARRWSGRPGRRFESLEALKKAAEIRPSPELRNEAIACMALTDLRVTKEWQIEEPGETQVFFSPAFDKYVVVNHPDKPATLFRLEDRAELMRAPMVVPRILNHYRFSPDGRYLALASQPNGDYSGALHVWDTIRNTIIFQLHTNISIGTTDFSPDSKRLAVAFLTPSAAQPALLEVYDLNSGRRLYAVEEKAHVWGACFDPSGRQLAVSYRTLPNVQIRDLESQRVVRTLPHPKPVMALAWHPDGTLLVTGCTDTHAYVWDVVTGNLRNVLRGHQSEVIGLVFNHRGDLLVTGSWDGTVRLWDPLGMTLPLNMACGSVGFSPDDRRLLCAFPKRRYGFAEVADGAECRVLHSDIEPGKGPRGCHFSPDGLWLASAHTDGARTWEAATGKEVARLPLGNTWSALFHSNGRSLFTSGTGGVRQWPLAWQQDGQTGRLQLGPPRTLKSSGRCGRASLDRAGRLVSFVDGDRVRIVDVESGSDEIPAIESGAAYTALSPDGKWRANSGSGIAHRVQIRGLQTGEMTRELPETTGGSAISFSPDGKWLTTCSATECRFWAIGSWECVEVVQRGGSAAEAHVAFSHDNSMVAIPLVSRGLRLLTPGSWKELADLEPPSPQYLSDLAFSPDDGQLAAAAETKQIHLWDLRSIRRQLAEMKLDWNALPFLPLRTNQIQGPITVTVLTVTNEAKTLERRAP